MPYKSKKDQAAASKRHYEANKEKVKSRSRERNKKQLVVNKEYVDKVKSMNKVIRILKKTEDKIKTIAVGDNYNDLDMLKNSDVPCLVFNDQFKLDQINIANLVFSNQPSPEGWADVIKMALAKLNYNV